MDKQQVLAAIKVLSAQKAIKQDELITAYQEGQQSSSDTTLTRHVSTPEVLYFVGGFVVVMGIATLIGQNWEELNSVSRILATLGVGIVAYLVGVLLSFQPKLSSVGQAFFLISGIVIPMGLFVVYDTAGLSLTPDVVLSQIAAICLTLFVASLLLLRRDIFLIFSIIFAILLFYSFSNILIGKAHFELEFFQYRTLVVGASLLSLGYALTKNNKEPIGQALYSFGILAVLIAAFILGGWQPNQNILWELLFPGIAMGAILASSYIKNSAFVIFGTLALMGYILKITGEYFAKSLGWPLALVIAGLLLIIVGYFSFSYSKGLKEKTALSTG